MYSNGSHLYVANVNQFVPIESNFMDLEGKTLANFWTISEENGQCVMLAESLFKISDIEQHGSDQLSWLERRANNAKVTGSIPLLDNNFFSLFNLKVNVMHNLYVRGFTKFGIKAL